MRKALITLVGLFAALFAVVGLTACGKGETPGNGRISVVTTVFPIYDWTRQLADGDPDVEITYLCSSGVDMHSFEPSIEDIVSISECDIFVYIGGTSDEWVKDALSQSHKDGRIVIDLMEVIGDRALDEEEKEGMAEDHDEEEDAKDEHLWMSPENASVCVDAIEEALSEKLPEKAEIFEKRKTGYQNELTQLQKDYLDAAENAHCRTLVFAGRFPFLYLLKDTGLDYYAAFPGCSAESETSFETIIFLAEKAEETGAAAVITTDDEKQDVAETVIRVSGNRDLKLLHMYSMQNVSAKDAENETYISYMRKDLETIKKATGR